MNQHKFKTIQKIEKIESHFMIEFLKNEGSKTEDAFHRLGLIIMLTSSDDAITKKVMVWRDQLQNILESDIEGVKKSKEKILKDNPNVKIPEVITPESYNYTFNIQHPIMWKMIDALKNIDSEISEIENLWLSGLVDDQQRQSAIVNARTILRINTGKIFKATSPGKDTNGRFNIGQFLSLLRGGLELYVEEDDLNNLAKKLPKKVNKEKSNDNKTLIPKSNDKSKIISQINA